MSTQGTQAKRSPRNPVRLTEALGELVGDDDRPGGSGGALVARHGPVALDLAHLAAQRISQRQIDVSMELTEAITYGRTAIDLARFLLGRRRRRRGEPVEVHVNPDRVTYVEPAIEYRSASF